MTPTPVWVIGAGGLLGSHVTAALRRRGREVMVRAIPWEDPSAAREELRRGIGEMLARAGSGRWDLTWCAGAGVVATRPERLAAEVEVFRCFLDDLAERSTPGPGRGAGAVDGRLRGAIFLSSSAGGLYAGSPGRPPFTESAPVRPLVAYGESKAAMEQMLADHAARSGTAVLVGRIANLYGPGQDLSKPQGLISQICLTHVTGRPLTVYVPLDTMRHYVYAADCGTLVAAALERLRDRVAQEDVPVVTKIVTSRQVATIAALLAESARLFKKRPRVIVKAPVEGTGQVPDLRLRSVVWPELDVHLTCPLTVGMARTAADVAARARMGTAPAA